MKTFWPSVLTEIEQSLGIKPVTDAKLCIMGDCYHVPYYATVCAYSNMCNHSTIVRINAEDECHVRANNTLQKIPETGVD